MTQQYVQYLRKTIDQNGIPAPYITNLKHNKCIFDVLCGQSPLFPTCINFSLSMAR